MRYTEADLDRLKGALADGAKSVTLSDGSTTVYRDLAELQKALRLVEADLAAARGTTPRRRAAVTYTTKGVY